MAKQSAFTFVKLNIIKVTRDQEASIKLFSDTASDIADIIKQINNHSFEISLEYQNTSSTNLKYEIKEKNIKNGVIQIFLNYPEPSLISN